LQLFLRVTAFCALAAVFRAAAAVFRSAMLPVPCFSTLIKRLVFAAFLFLHERPAIWLSSALFVTSITPQPACAAYDEYRKMRGKDRKQEKQGRGMQ
jgi:hypothetical protein